MNGVASFRSVAVLRTDKKINLIYGLNGTGKSTISGFLYEPTNSRYSKCSFAFGHSDPVAVYNQKFIQDNFFVADSLKGVFSLSKENKEAEEKVLRANAAIAALGEQLTARRSAKEEIAKVLEAQKRAALEKVWEIKTRYEGGALDYCLSGLKGQKDRLFSHLLAVPKPKLEPLRGIPVLQSEVEALGKGAQLQIDIPKITFAAESVESDSLFTKPIAGSGESRVAALIEQLGNSDWVRSGLRYLPDHAHEGSQPCPFCQERTITVSFTEDLKRFFDDSYQANISALEQMRVAYSKSINGVPELSSYTANPFAQSRVADLSAKYQDLSKILAKNVKEIDRKIANPSTSVALAASGGSIARFNEEVAAINREIGVYNEKLRNRDQALNSARSEFWGALRWQYDQTISQYQESVSRAEKATRDVSADIERIQASISEEQQNISTAQKETVNVDEAVDAINAGLLDLGIDGFSVSKVSQHLYRVVRVGDPESVFHTLSEGEKMVISFLYFCEVCKGRSSADDTSSKRIVVIDDPISSLSHLYVFNVGRLIRSIFFQSERIRQVFVLTHSLYFFYELTDTNKERRAGNQRLFRLSKTAVGSSIHEMKYEEIQNDYQAYWSVVNDSDQPPALIANCMRNIVEYFFGFVRKKDLNAVFQMKELQELKFQAFYRYVNRESHSIGQNIIDMKEFDYSTFMEGLRLIFDKTGYGDHYAAMSKV